MKGFYITVSFAANQDMHALTKNLSSFLPIISFKLKLEKRVAFLKCIYLGLQKSVSDLIR